jgi:hypothetical protein
MPVHQSQHNQGVHYSWGSPTLPPLDEIPFRVWRLLHIQVRRASEPHPDISLQSHERLKPQWRIRFILFQGRGDRAPQPSIGVQQRCQGVWQIPERRPGGPARSWRADRRRRARGGRRTGARPHHGRLESDQSAGLALSRAVSQAVGSLSLHLRFNARRILCHRARAQGFIHTV